MPVRLRPAETKEFIMQKVFLSFRLLKMNSSKQQLSSHLSTECSIKNNSCKEFSVEKSSSSNSPTELLLLCSRNSLVIARLDFLAVNPTAVGWVGGGGWVANWRQSCALGFVQFIWLQDYNCACPARFFIVRGWLAAEKINWQWLQ